MFGFGSRKPAASRLQAILADYPPFTPLHLGRNSAEPWPGPVLTLEQCRENLAQYREAIPARLDVLRPALSALGIEMDLAYVDAPLFVERLHHALFAEMQALDRPALFDHNAYELSARSGADIGLSLMGDLGMLDADVVMKAKPGCFLGLDLDRADRKMTEWHRPCLLGLIDSLFPNLPPAKFHLDAEWLGYIPGRRSSTGLVHPDAVPPVENPQVIGGWMAIRLARYEVAPSLQALLDTTWLGNAA